jgi:hypothetical protein
LARNKVNQSQSVKPHKHNRQRHKLADQLVGRVNFSVIQTWVDQALKVYIPVQLQQCKRNRRVYRPLSLVALALVAVCMVCYLVVL